MGIGRLDLTDKFIYLDIISNPEITFFRSVYLKHTYFIIETVKNKFDRIINFGEKTSCNFSKNVYDLMSNIVLVINIKGNNIKWHNKLAFKILEYIELEINGNIIDRQYGSWLNIWYELTKFKYQRYDEILNGECDNFKLLIPLKFWFCRYINNCLPLVCLKNSILKLNLSLNKIENCINNCHLKNNILIKDIYLLIDYITLDKPERCLFESKVNKCVIENVKKIDKIINKGECIDLQFYNYTKILFWEINNLDKDDKVLQFIKYNDEPGININNFEYFNLIQPYNFFNGDLSYNKFVYCYGDPMNINKSFYINLNNIKLKYRIIGNKEKYNITFYTLNYNQLIFKEGRGNLQFTY